MRLDRLKRARFVGLASTALLTLVLSSCASDAPQDGFSDVYGSYARKINRLAHPVFIIAVLVGVLVYGLVAWCIVKYRRKGDDDIPKQVHGNTVGEILWTATPVLLLGVIGVFSVNLVFQVAKTPTNPLEVTVIGHQWWWEYHYPVPGESVLRASNAPVDDPVNPGRKIAGVTRESGKYVAGANELHIPAGRPVRLTITSKDVIHSYWVPKLAGKMDAVPGRLNHLNIEADLDLVKDGKSKVIFGQCAEFCSTSHANMRFKVVVDPPAKFEEWLRGQQAAKATPTTELAKAGEEIFNGSGACTSCHYVESDKGYDPTVDAGKIGPNLTHVASRQTFAGAIAPMDAVNLRAWLKNPQAFKPGSKMVIRKLSDDEITKLVAYIQSLK